jgi:uncharacterized SAM-binding protein YcdF (DUF218 family)
MRAPVELASSLVKSLLPGSTAFLVAGLIVGLFLLYAPGLWKWGRRWLAVLAVVYVVLAMPVVAARLRRGFGPTYVPIASPVDALGAKTVVVLGNGAVTHTDGATVVPVLARRTAFNVMEGARLYRLLGQPKLVLSGGIPDPEVQLVSEAEVMAEALERLGVPRSHMVLEGRSINTYQQAREVRALIGTDGPIVLVTTSTHMPRALALFKAQGLKPVPSPSRANDLPWHGPAWSRFLPDAGALAASQMALYEYLALAKGWERGWLVLDDVP